MAYTVPTYQDLVARFPEFRSVAPQRASAILAEAARNVDTSWIEADYQPAILYLAAHMIVMEDGANAGANAALGSGPIRTMSLGNASETYASPGGDSLKNSEFGMTIYGIRFLRLRYANVGGARAV